MVEVAPVVVDANEHGADHGWIRSTSGLKGRHAHPAVDAAHTSVVLERVICNGLHR